MRNSITQHKTTEPAISASTFSGSIRGSSRAMRSWSMLVVAIIAVPDEAGLAKPVASALVQQTRVQPGK